MASGGTDRRAGAGPGWRQRYLHPAVATLVRTGSPAVGFDGLAERYARRDQLVGGWLSGWLDAQLADAGGATALELGCGTGRLAARLGERYDQVRAVDISPAMIDVARRLHPHPRVSYVSGDLFAEGGQYDLVVSMMVMHHAEPLERALATVRRLVAPGGRLLLADAVEPWRSRRQIHLHHARMFWWDLRARRPDAVERFLLTSDRVWVEHLLADRLLTGTEFAEVYGRAFPGARIGEVDSFATLLWQRPPADQPG
jgi:SAM-dependent methyltransferase